MGFQLFSRDGDFKADPHGEGVDLGFGQPSELGGGRFALGGEGRGRRAICLGCIIERGTKRLQNFVAVFDFSEFGGHVLCKCNDLGDSVAVFALEAVEEGETVFDFDEAFG